MDISPEEITRQGFLAIILLAVALISFWVFSRVLATIFVAITIAYVLYPIRNKLVDKGLSSTLSSLTVTSLAFIILLTLAAPFIIVLYRRREILLGFLQDIPQSIELELLGREFTIQSSLIVETLRDTVTNTAINLAQSTPSLLLKFLLLIVLVFAILRNPMKIKNTLLEIVPGHHQQTVLEYNKAIKQTITGLYIVQLSTAILTFLVGLPVFYLLGYEPFVSLALLGGLLQFVPVLGPSILVIGLAAFEVLTIDLMSGVIVLIIGLLFVAALPDLMLRPQLADRTTGLPASLYFLGFIGGILTLGAIGIIVGPLIIALFLKTVELMAEKQ